MENKDQRSGIGFFGILTIMFIGLKLGHVIDWSWWTVLSPIWATFVIVVVIALIAVIGNLLLNDDRT